MADVIILPPFISTKPDSPDSSIVSSSEWNAARLISGGLQGQLMARSSGSLTGASYVDGAKINLSSASYSGASPADVTSLVITFTTTVQLMLVYHATAVTSGSANVLVSLKRDGAVVDTFTIDGIGHGASAPFVIGESPSTHTYTVALTAVSGTFTSSNARLVAFSIGVA
jgi:hypothetical protein